MAFYIILYVYVGSIECSLFRIYYCCPIGFPSSSILIEDLKESLLLALSTLSISILPALSNLSVVVFLDLFEGFLEESYLLKFLGFRKLYCYYFSS